jgi:CDP-paratose 2-epimerase
MPLDFHTPYGVSKGAADQYVLDYCRIYGIPSVVFRQSCIYGKHQRGKEEQGWVAWFLIANQTGQPLTIYGDGNQIRDTLYVGDLIDAYELAVKNIDKVKGTAYNIGGGEKNTLSLNELVSKANITVPITYTDWRPADQKYYVSDLTKIKKELKWKPTTSVAEGLKIMQEYVSQKWPK